MTVWWLKTMGLRTPSPIGVGHPELRNQFRTLVARGDSSERWWRATMGLRTPSPIGVGHPELRNQFRALVGVRSQFRGGSGARRRSFGNPMPLEDPPRAP